MTRGSEIRGNKAVNGKTSPDKPVATSSQLQKIRRGRGLGATEIARLVGVSRQTIYAIESGDYVPNTAVALQLARVLEVTVEELFSLGAVSERPPVRVNAELLAAGGDEYATGELVRIGRVGKRTIAVPAPRFPVFLSEADGAIVAQSKGRATIRTVSESSTSGNALVIAGCDPALSVLAGELQSNGTDVISVPCSSQEALQWLRKGLVHVAGTHLCDRATGEYNVPLVKALFGKNNVHVVTFAEWQEGLAVRRGNPKQIRSVADLNDKQISIVNREKGSGARELLDTSLQAAKIAPESIRGYDQILPGHLTAALAVANSQADCAVVTISAAKCFGLDFMPLSTSRFDLIVAASEIDAAGIRTLLDALNRASLRRKLAMLAGYEVRHTGEMLM
jgi:molybdopterin molybdotransferase/putative molybdopterin biosynthesis protein